MPCRRFVNAGKLTDHEMVDLREPGIRRRAVPWRYAWASMSDEFHPHNQEEWDAHLENLEGDDDEQRT